MIFITGLIPGLMIWLNRVLRKRQDFFIEFRNLNALNSVGYREFFDFFDGKISREKAIELIKRNSRRYAKRQITWWSKDKDIKWFHPEQVQEYKFIETIVS